MQDNKAFETSKPIPIPQKCTTTINRCKVIINFAPDNNENSIETVKSILLSTYYQDISPKAEGNLVG